MFVYKRMTQNPVTISHDISIFDAMEVMRISKVRRLPVLNGGQLVGIVTDRDLNTAAPSPVTTLSKYEASYLLTKLKVSEIMTKKLFTVKASATIEEAALLMYKNKIGGLPVLDEQDKLVGIITETDIFKVLVDVMGLPEGKTRITLSVNDRPGVLAEIGAIFKEANGNITSFATLEANDGEKELVFRGDFGDMQAINKIKDKLQEQGFKVIDITKIE